MDHPRSRGVYQRRWLEDGAVEGSSPLARGLPRPRLRWLRRVRIIPARAGFTRRRSRHRSRRRDHPRSRGVYTAAGGVRARPTGSSPLARGLRPGYYWESDYPRIIPARAGFTVSGPTANWTRKDHPRSRGVYPGRGASTRSTPGSSPLARGLRVTAEALRDALGIIPARAGFTGHAVRRVHGVPDHPRSRGVYPTARCGSSPPTGSSPLARGLRARARRRARHWRIIPARAGFTIIRRPWCRTRADHPRSRGVYPTAGLSPSSLRGSSPLARGLPAGDAAAADRSGIIPARAGFTGRLRPDAAVGRDHPRSRGVYMRRARHTHGGAGSSPLARGLLDTTAHTADLSGIIPARAGFTGLPVRCRGQAEDHPRSRGVYP